MALKTVSNPFSSSRPERPFSLRHFGQVSLVLNHSSRHNLQPRSDLQQVPTTGFSIAPLHIVHSSDFSISIMLLLSTFKMIAVVSTRATLLAVSTTSVRAPSSSVSSLFEYDALLKCVQKVPSWTKA